MLTLKNISQATQMAFSDYQNHSDKKLKKILSLLTSDPLGEMIKEEFYFNFNKLCAQSIISDKPMSIPSSIPKYDSIWLMEWSKQFDSNYDVNKPIKKFDFTFLDIESDKLKSIFSLGQDYEKMDKIRDKLVEVIPYSEKEQNRYKIALKNTIFSMAMIKYFNYQGVEEDISNIIRCYYSTFDKKGELYSAVYNSKDIEKLKKDKIQEFSPKNENDMLMLKFLSQDKKMFAEIFNKNLGILSDKYALDMQELFLNMVIIENYKELSESLPEKEEKVKKKKI